MAIPLLNPFFAIGVIVFSALVNIVLFIKYDITRFRVSKYFKIISQISFIMFNLMFIVTDIIYNYYPNVSQETLKIIGITSIGLICMVTLLEVLEMMTEILVIVIEIVKAILKKIRKLR